MKTGDRNGCGGYQSNGCGSYVNGCGGYANNGCGGLVGKNPAAAVQGASAAERQTTALRRAWQAARAVLA